MTTTEFKERLDCSNSIEELEQLRGDVASTMVKQIKDKVDEIASKTGWEQFMMSTSTLKNLVGVNNSGCNYLTVGILVPPRNRILCKYANKRVSIYVNEKRYNGSLSFIYVKELN